MTLGNWLLAAGMTANAMFPLIRDVVTANTSIQVKEKPQIWDRRGIPLGVTVGMIRRKAYLPPQSNMHRILIGGTRMGKSMWSINYVLHRESVCLIDNADGDSVDRILEAMPQERIGRTVVLDHSDRYYPLPVGLQRAAGGLYAEDDLMAQWLGFFERVFDCGGIYRTRTLLRNACKIAFADRNNTIVDVIDLLTNTTRRQSLIDSLDWREYRDAIAYWHQFDGLTDNAKMEILGPLLNRGDELMSQRFIRYTLGVPPELPYRQWMDSGTTVLIRCPKTLGEDAVRLITGLHVLGFWQAALSRANTAPSRRPPYHVIADEPQAWIGGGNSRLIDSLFSEAQKYGLGFTAIFQSYAQIEEESKALVRKMRDNAPDLLVFRTEDPRTKLGDYEVSLLPRYHFVARIGGGTPILLKAPRPPRPVRQDIDGILAHQRKVWNKHYRLIAGQIERRMGQWLQMPNANTEVSLKGKKSQLRPITLHQSLRESPIETIKSFSSSLIAE